MTTRGHWPGIETSLAKPVNGGGVTRDRALLAGKAGRAQEFGRAAGVPIV
jgi:hypothetical protein